MVEGILAPSQPERLAKLDHASRVRRGEMNVVEITEMVICTADGERQEGSYERRLECSASGSLN